MKLQFKPNVPIILCIILLTCIQFSNTLGQNNTKVNEPPVPIYIISPYHEDSLAAADRIAQGLSSSITNAFKKIDTVQQQIQKSSAESTVHFIWLYTLIALLGIMIIVLLFSTSRIKKEVVQLKRFERHQMLLSSESPALLQPIRALSESTSTIQESSVTPGAAKKHLPVRRKARIVKPRMKNKKTT